MKKITVALMAGIGLLGGIGNKATAQRRDFRKEKAQLVRAEREQNRQARTEREQKFNSMGNNMLRLTAFTAMDIGIGMGASYERIIDQRGTVGLVLPVYLLWEEKDNAYDPITGNIQYGTGSAYFYASPGIKVYPFGQRRVTYAVGPSLMVGAGSNNEWRYNQSTGVEENMNVSKFRFGLIVNNYVNFQITQGFNLGLELGLGARYIDREKIKPANSSYTQTYNNGMNVTGQFSLTLGYRF
ncbi:MAG: hypothetical protein QM642_02765 [Edaphocola sp.]